MAFEILEDYRWGGASLYYGDPEELLLIHPNVRSCAAFLGRKKDGEHLIVATTFLLWLRDIPYNFLYLVTAGHIIRRTLDPDYSDDGMVYIYLNSKKGQRFKTIQCNAKLWFFHPTDDAIDVAVLPFKALPDLDHTALEPEVYDMLLGEPSAKHRWRIDIGTDVFITGLFLRHFGRERNIPIIRTGTIAALPEEPIEIGQEGEERRVKAYLIETHSIGGLSGSPVFANPMNIETQDERSELRTMHIWIGLVSAHWQFDQDKTEAQQLNSGIAIVSPRESVLEVLRLHPRLIEMRRQEKTRRMAKDAPTLDDAQRAKRKTRDVPIPPVARKKFFEDLEKVTDRRKK